MKKLIVDRFQAKTVRDNTEFSLIKSVRRCANHALVDDLFDAINRSFPVGAKFWVAEPICSVKPHGSGIMTGREHFDADPVPNGWGRHTLARPGSRVHWGEHRFCVEVIKVDAPPISRIKDEMACVKVWFKKVSTK